MINEPLLEITWLKTFVTVARLGSMTEATRTLCRSQSAISMHIKNIEDNLGRKIFFRGERKLRLTSSGEDLLQHASNILAVYNSAMKSLAGSEAIGKVTLGIPDDYVFSYLPKVLNALTVKYPHIEISLVCEPSSSLIPKVENDDIDIAVVTRERNIKGKHLFNEPLVWVGSPHHHLLGLDPLPIAIYEPGSEGREMIMKGLAKRGISYRIVYSSPYVTGQIAAVQSGMAITVLARCCVPEHLNIINDDMLPDFEELEIALITSRKNESSEIVDLLAREIVAVLGNK